MEGQIQDMTAMVEVEREPGLRRVLGRVVGREPGPTVVVIGGLHGNEPSGVEALLRLLPALEGRPGLRGELLALAGNLEALERRQRFVGRDLNRAWAEERMDRLRSRPPATLDGEDRQQLELLAELEETLGRATGITYVIDLHSTSGAGPAFATVSDSLFNRAFALHLPVPIVLGLEEELTGTLLSYIGDQGHITLGFEGGQHEAPSSVANAEAALWLLLAAAGFLPPGDHPELERSRRTLEEAGRGLPRVVELRHRHPVTPGDGFEMAPGLLSFQPVTAGQLMARDRRGEIRSPEDGRVLMPLYQAQGEDGFFVIREFRPFWLWVSALLRRLRADALVHLMPGVRRHPGRADTYIVNRRVARWFALELFHLLGFRRHGEIDERSLTVARRPEQLRVELRRDR